MALTLERTGVLTCVIYIGGVYFRMLVLLACFFVNSMSFNWSLTVFCNTCLKYTAHAFASVSQTLIFKKYFIYLFLDRGEGKENERERNIHVWLPLAHPPRGGPTWPATQACALTGNRTSVPLVHRLMLNPLSHTSQGSETLIKLLKLVAP